ncbi:MAG: serine/threonine protein kinase [Deltaproteobacteria bacterium]|nr:serine/threonine protein kinase [Deltaproteobacteria bacterium]
MAEFGRYELVERVALGGMAEVFLARIAGPDGFQKEVCIKRILPQFNEEPDFVRMFVDEAKVAAKLQHANVVPVFDFGQVEGTYYIAMEYVHGRDLRTIIRQAFHAGTPPGPWRAAAIVADMCKGLHYAHTREGMNLVHRDISPHNVMLSMGGEVKVMDFGIAKAADRITHTGTGIIKGKIPYMAPEQAAGAELDHRVDQFATGLVLYELLTGRRAYDGPDPVALRKALEGAVSPPSLAVPETPPELDEIFLRATARDPAARFPDMRALERALSGLGYRRAPDDDELDLARYMKALFGTGARQKTAVMPADMTPSAPSSVAPAPATGPRFAGVEASLPTAASADVVPAEGTPAPEPAAAPAEAPEVTLTAQGTPTPLAPPTPSAVLPPSAVATVPSESAHPAGWAAPPWWQVGGVAVVAALLALGTAGLLVPRFTANRAAAPTQPPPAAAQPARHAAPEPQPADPIPAAAAPQPAPAPPEPAPPGPSTAAPAPARSEPRPEEPTEPRPARGRGVVRVVNQAGWAQVWVKGKMVLAETPGSMELEAGRHAVQFRNPETGQSAQMTVTVKAGQTVRVVNPLQ